MGERNSKLKQITVCVISRGLAVSFLTSASDWDSGGGHFPPDEDRDISLNAGLLVIHPPDVTASLRMFH